MRAMRFTDLRVYRASMKLCDDIYSVTEGLPASEEYGLKSQLRRAVVSIGSDIAEGFGRWTPRDQARFSEIAKGSAEEIRHLLIVCARRGFLTIDPEIDRTIGSVCGRLFNLRVVVLQKARGPR